MVNKNSRSDVSQFFILFRSRSNYNITAQRIHNATNWAGQQTWNQFMLQSHPLTFVSIQLPIRHRCFSRVSVILGDSDITKPRLKFQLISRSPVIFSFSYFRTSAKLAYQARVKSLFMCRILSHICFYRA